MKDHKKDLEIIEQFLDGTFSESENMEIEERLRTDLDFSDLYNFRIKLAKKWDEANRYAQIKTKVVQQVNAVKKRRKQKIYYRVAAVLALFVAFPGILYHYKSNKDVQLASTLTQELLMNQPENKASVNYYDDQFRFISPINNEAIELFEDILFKWDCSLDVETTIIIKLVENDSIVKRVPVKSLNKEYKLDSKLEEGNYSWILEGFEGKKYFTIH